VRISLDLENRQQPDFHLQIREFHLVVMQVLADNHKSRFDAQLFEMVNSNEENNEKTG